jgi:hypothetical protein
MSVDYSVILWLLKLGALPNLYFLLRASAANAAVPVVVAAEVFFAASLYRCLFPVRYEHHVVFHDSALSSVFATRVVATFAEVAFIFLLASVLWHLNVDHVAWVDHLASLMVLQVVICQACVWVAVVAERFEFYFYEELGWLFMFLANTIASAYLYSAARSAAEGEVLLKWNLCFGVVYLPFQIANLFAVRTQAKKRERSDSSWTWDGLVTGVRRSIRSKNQRTDAEAWGGMVGVVWMIGYWATILPAWVYGIVRAFSTDR